MTLALSRSSLFKRRGQPLAGIVSGEESGLSSDFQIVCTIKTSDHPLALQGYEITLCGLVRQYQI